MTVELHPITGIPEVAHGTDIAGLIVDAVEDLGVGFRAGDILVVTHKIVSKAEGAVARLHGDDEDGAYRRLVEEEAVEVIRRRGDLAITITKHGFICANAGADRSNTAPGTAVLLPDRPDRSAHSIRMGVRTRTGVDLAVIVTDTFGRAWRRGLVDVAIGVSGIDPILDLRGTTDQQGRVLEVTEVAIVDEIAAAADLVMGKASGVPAALIRGLELPMGDGRIADIVRSPHEDLFR